MALYILLVTRWSVTSEGVLNKLKNQDMYAISNRVNLKNLPLSGKVPSVRGGNLGF